ncbi:MAG: DUF4423 domain-containing protein [Bdellovibrionaceae bacterium]|nr:DUF4423 domain-containing protein [Pseudobdellovibrionaceae bacterium]
MIIFEITNYRKGFGRLFKQEKKLRGARWSLSKLAGKLGIQASYLTNVTKERAHFSLDQIFLVGEALGLKEAETYFLSTLMQYERATHPRLKKRLGEELAHIRGENLRAEKVITTRESPLSEIDRAKYYLDPMIELMHMFLSIDHAPVEIALIADAWQLPEKRVSDIITFLQSVGLIKLASSKWKVESLHQHLSRDSFLTRPQQMLKRMKALEMIQKHSKEKVYSYMGTMTADEATREQIQILFLNFLKECELLIRESPAKDIYHIQFDLFPWMVK